MPNNFISGIEQEEAWPLIRDHHYSKRMPGSIVASYAIWTEGGLFGDRGKPIAAIIFSSPPTRWSESVIELTRLVRLPDCEVPLSGLIAFGCSQLKKLGHPLVVSFADWTQNHHGGIYQASSFQYGGQRDRVVDGCIINGVFIPGRSCNAQWGTRSPTKLQASMPDCKIEPHYDEGKHLYWRALRVSGRSMAKRLELKSLPFPKPNAARPLDERLPRRASDVQPVGAAPRILE